LYKHQLAFISTDHHQWLKCKIRGGGTACPCVPLHFNHRSPPN